ncbi:chondroitinase-B domain-containing protein [Joostella sp. CR20]|uniref:chondroitinase-B domain-containing protein n=1 Tax=Joostella sp. CR20 TaxID=2804312 RepID=UPI00313D85B4
MKNTKLFSLLFITVLAFSCAKQSELKTLKNLSEFNEAISKAKPGDTLILANGTWENAELLFEAKGTSDSLITLKAETKGEVILTGNSNLRIAGEYLVVEGLVFKDGFTPTNEVISFKKDNKNLANNCRLTECVIDNFSNPERHEADTWVAIYGKNNRIDHNHLEGKRNRGVTMTVRLNTEESRENNHRIDHNYFGPRQNLGSNGGETLRIGTSHYSLTNSKTLVEYNYFDRCNGEHEIISNKSCQNTFKNNVFYECTGTLTMRHGNETWVEGNVFFGNGKLNTGGIRVINGQQTVVNNYGEGLTGYRFRGAFVVMNGVPNSPINRYFQVEDARVENNTFINSDHVQLCAGSDDERSVTPINSVMANNIFYNEHKNQLFTVYDDISGISFKNNIVSPNIQPLTKDGFSQQEITFKRAENGLLEPTSNINAGAKIAGEIPSKTTTGATWYQKDVAEASLSSGQIIKVAPGLNTLVEAVAKANAGDILQLENTEPYLLSKTITIAKPLTIRASTQKRATILFEKKNAIEIENGGKLALEGIIFDGKNAPDRTGNAVITTSKYSMNDNYKLFINHCDFVNLDMNHSFNAIKTYKNTFADTISIKNSKFETITGDVLSLNQENEDIGIYNAEYVILKNNVFNNIEGVALNLYRGGSDESTFGPFLDLEHCVFNNVGNGKRNTTDAAVTLYGVQDIDIKNNIFKDSKPLKAHLVVGEPIVNISHSTFYNTPKPIITGDQAYEISSIWSENPQLTADFKVDENSTLKNKATDGKNIGIIDESL